MLYTHSHSHPAERRACYTQAAAWTLPPVCHQQHTRCSAPLPPANSPYTASHSHLAGSMQWLVRLLQAQALLPTAAGPHTLQQPAAHDSTHTHNGSCSGCGRRLLQWLQSNTDAVRLAMRCCGLRAHYAQGSPSRSHTPGSQGQGVPGRVKSSSTVRGRSFTQVTVTPGS